MKGSFKGTFKTSGSDFDPTPIIKVVVIIVAAFTVIAFIVTFIWYIAVFFIGMVIGGTIVALRARKRIQGNGSQTAIGSHQVGSSDDYIRVSHVVAILHGPSDERRGIQERRDDISRRDTGRAGTYDMVEKEVED
jgi:hypothetical protein